MDQYQQQQQGGFGFNVNDYEAQEAFDNLPPAWYNVFIEDSEMKANASGKGTACANVYAVFGGRFDGRKLFDNLNVIHENEQAQEIARKHLRTIQDAIGKQSIAGPWDLKGCYMCVKVGLSRPKKDATDAEKAAFEPRNEVKGYKAFDAALHAQNQQAPAQGYNVQVQPQGPQMGNTPNFAPQSPQFVQQPMQHQPQFQPQQQPQQQMPQQSNVQSNVQPQQQFQPQAQPQQQFNPNAQQPNNVPQPGNAPGSQPGQMNGQPGQAQFAPGAMGQDGQPSQGQAAPNAQPQVAPQQTFTPQPGGMPNNAQPPGPNQNVQQPQQNMAQPNPQFQPQQQQQMQQQPQQGQPSQSGNAPPPGAAW